MRLSPWNPPLCTATVAYYEHVVKSLDTIFVMRYTIAMEIFLTTALFLAGLIVGSFLSALVPRIYAKQTLLGRSQCDQCNQQLTVAQLVPLVSYIYFKGRCKQCKTKISWEYPVLEACMGVLFVLFGMYVAGIAELVRDLIIVTLLAFTFLYDGKYGYILDRATLIPALIFFVVAWIFGWNTPTNMLLGALIGGGIFVIQYVVSQGKWVGGGDIRLGVFMGVILGWPLTIVALMLAYVGGAIISLTYIFFKKKDMQSAIPFGTYLTLGTVAAMLWGNELTQWYIGLL